MIKCKKVLVQPPKAGKNKHFGYVAKNARIDEKIKESRMFRAIDINIDRCFMVVISKKYFKIAK